MIEQIAQLFLVNAWLIIGVSIAFFVATLIAIPIVLVRLPHDYFDENRPHYFLRNHHPAVRVTAYVLKNLIGVIFLVAGAAMLVLPGQGLLTMLIGVSLTDFPGKRKLERKLIGRPAVLRAIDTIRQKFDRPPLTLNNDSP